MGRPKKSARQPMTDASIMPWGKHRGTALANIPGDYLLKLYGEWDLASGGDIYLGLKDYIEDNMLLLKREARVR
jgi:hypothetical protein